MRPRTNPSSTSRASRRRPRRPLTAMPLATVTKRTIRGIAKELIAQHTTDIAYTIHKGLFQSKPLTALKYLTFVGDRAEGRPVETHKMVDTPSKESYDLSALSPDERKALLSLLARARAAQEAK